MFKEQIVKKWQEWISVFLLMVGALLLASNLTITKWAFPILCIGRGWLSILMLKRKDWPLFISNFSFFVIDMIGIYRWF